MNRTRALLVLVALLVCAAPAAAQTGVTVKPSANAPENARKLGPLCRADTPSFRLWWSDTPGAPGAVAGSDGNCATLPVVVSELALTAETARLRAAGLGFGAMVGDGPPVFLRNPGLLRTLGRLKPSSRGRALGGISRPARGSFLAGLSKKQRTRVLRGLPNRLKKRILVDVGRAQRGKPSDFVGGDRRVDIVIDASGVTGQVQAQQTGLSPCRARVSGRKRTFVSSWAVVLAPPAEPSPRSVLAHELFHVAQCNLGSGSGTPILVREGTAEWFSAVAEPAGYPGVVGPTGSVSNGNARAVSFCRNFDPAGPGTSPYLSWAVWEALDPGTARSGTVLPVIAGFPGSAAVEPDAAAVIAKVGAARWVEALRTAARSVCGTQRSPSGAVTFAPDIRGFIGGGVTPASAGAPAVVNVPSGGVSSVAAVWSGSATSVTLTLSSPQAPAEALLPSVVVTSRAGLLTPVVRNGAVVVDIPAASRSERVAPVTIANPVAAGPVAVNVQVTTTP